MNIPVIPATKHEYHMSISDKGRDPENPWFWSVSCQRDDGWFKHVAYGNAATREQALQEVASVLLKEIQA